MYIYSFKKHIYIYIAYVYICLLYISDHSYTQVCIEGDTCTDGSETQPYYTMDVMKISTVGHCFDRMCCVAHCNKQYATHYCSCLIVCRLMNFTEALIQLIDHSDFTQSDIV